MTYLPIENYGVIGNMRSIALVGMNGSIDFLCYPNVDSPTVFAALLDEKQGGCWQIEAQLSDMRIRQLYLPDTNVLITRFLAEEGVAELTDFMPIESEAEEPNEIVRMITVIRGTVGFKMRCQPRFKYATSKHRTELGERCATFFPSDDTSQGMSLYSTAALNQRGQDVFSQFTLEAGETATFVLGRPRVEGEPPEMQLIDVRLRHTIRFWKTWIAKSKYKGRWREMVHRSALLLKLLISREHGSLIAAPTFSLPEEIGGVRNWDYRFTWLRDATFTLYALIRLGFVDETEAFIDWLKGRLGDDAERGPLHRRDDTGPPFRVREFPSRTNRKCRLSAASTRHLR
jgi:GH15 family glucan-1,4-alpha-glucosidase